MALGWRRWVGLVTAMAAMYSDVMCRGGNGNRYIFYEMKKDPHFSSIIVWTFQGHIIGRPYEQRLALESDHNHGPRYPMYVLTP